MGTTATPISNISNVTQIDDHKRSDDIFCHLEHHHEVAKFVVTLLVNVGGIVLTILSTVFAALNNAIDPSLRGIFISFSLANFTGTLMLTYDTITTICYQSNTKTGVVINISISLTLSHMMFLLLAEYLILTSVVRRSVKDFSGLLIIAWIISVCVGSTMVITTNKAGRIIFVAVLILVILCMGVGFFSIIKKSQRRVKVLESYEKKYLNLHHHKSRVTKRIWKLQYYAIILTSYVVCASPWVIEQVYEGLTRSNYNTITIIASIPLIIYTTNFYFPSVIIIYLWKKKYRAKKRVEKLYAFARTPKMLGTKKYEMRRIYDDMDQNISVEI